MDLLRSFLYRRRRGGLMVSALDSGSSGPGIERRPGSLCCVLGQDTQFTLTVPLSTQEYINEYRRIVRATANEYIGNLERKWL